MKTSTNRRVALKAALAAALALVVGVGPAQARPAQIPPAESPYILIYYDGHMHSTYSDGSGTVTDIKKTALERGLDAVIITDHCEDLTLPEWQSLVKETGQVSDGSFLAIPAFENTGNESLFNRDHILSYRAPDPFVGDDAAEQCPRELWPSDKNPAGTGPANPENLAKWVDYTRDQGGFAIHAHTFGTTKMSYGVGLIEIYNQSAVNDIAGYAKLLGYGDEEAQRFAVMLNDLAVYGERDVNTPFQFAGFATPVPIRTGLHAIVGLWLGSPEAPLTSWDELLMSYIRGESERPFFAVANSDAHKTGTAESEVGQGRNGVYVRELTAEEVFSAVERGRGFATSGPFLDITVNGRMMGQTARAGIGGRVSIGLRAGSADSAAEIVRVALVGNWGGEEWELAPPVAEWEEQVETQIEGLGYYRVEVVARDPTTGRESYAWSNPVFVRCSIWDSDCDGYVGILETLFGSRARDADSVPEHRLANGSCDNGRDDDGDGATDGADAGCEE